MKLPVAPLLFVVATAGCGGDEFADGCPDELTSCAIDDAGCRDFVWRYVSCLAEVSVDPVMPSYETLSVEAWVDLATGTSTAPSARQVRQGRQLNLIDFDDGEPGIAMGELADYAPAAYYLHDDHVVFVGPERFSEVTRYHVLAHEYVHALQMRRGLFDREDAATYDEYLMRITGSEGEAELYQVITYAALTGRSIFGFDFDVREPIDTIYADAVADPHPLQVARQLPYVYGTVRAFEIWSSGGPAALAAAVHRPPTSTLDLLEPGADVWFGPDTFDLTGTTFEVDVDDRLGWFPFEIALGKYGGAGSGRDSAWRGGRTFGLYDADANAVAFVWWIRLIRDRSGAPLEVIEARFASGRERVFSASNGPYVEVVVVAAETAEDAAQLEPAAMRFLDSL